MDKTTATATAIIMTTLILAGAGVIITDDNGGDTIYSFNVSYGNYSKVYSGIGGLDEQALGTMGIKKADIENVRDAEGRKLVREKIEHCWTGEHYLTGEIVTTCSDVKTGSFIWKKTENVYFCDYLNLELECESLSRVNEDKIQTRCYFDDTYKICLDGWYKK